MKIMEINWTDITIGELLEESDKFYLLCRGAEVSERKHFMIAISSCKIEQLSRLQKEAKLIRIED